MSSTPAAPQPEQQPGPSEAPAPGVTQPDPSRAPDPAEVEPDLPGVDPDWPQTARPA